MHRTDQDLIKAVVKEDSHTAFAELVKRYQSPLRYSLRQLTGWNEALADDLAQETFIKAHRALAGYKGKAKFSAGFIVLRTTKWSAISESRATVN